MRHVLIVLVLCAGLVADEEPAVPAELPPLALRAITTHSKAVTAAQKRFVEDVERADDALVRSLEGEMRKAVRGKRQDQAVAIRLKIEALQERDRLADPFVDGSTPAGAVAATPGGGGHGAGDIGVGKELVFSATRPLPIGAVRAGDVLTMQFVRGVWSFRGGQMNSPDAGKIDAKYRVAIFEKVQDGWTKIAIVDGGTATKPWSYEFISDKADVRLGINDDPNDSDNVGEVIYMVRLARKP